MNSYTGKGGAIIHIIIQMENTDYDGMVEMVLPIIIETFADKPDAAVWLKLLSKFKHPAVKVSVAALTALPKQTKDEMITSFVNDNNVVIARECTRLLSEKGVPLLVARVTAVQDGDGEFTVDIRYRRGN